MIEIGSQDRLFVLTGAGVSAESGLPTFRGAGGLWRGTRVEDVASPAAWARDPLMVWQFYSMRRRVHAGKEPNPAHFTLARLEDALGERLFLCTQNVDKLHDQAGSRRVQHMHGRLFQSRCDSCPRPPFDDENVYEDEVPRCRCGGRIRPHICWFGETPYEMDLIQLQLRRCTVFMAVGTSGVVYPAAAFAAQARSAAGARTYYVGPEEPANRSMFDECFQGPAGGLLPQLFFGPQLRTVSV
ncbi:MAG: Sir2 family NAD-dependent protein deacetylase [Terriglobales bacterium]